MVAADDEHFERNVTETVTDPFPGGVAEPVLRRDDLDQFAVVEHAERGNRARRVLVTDGVVHGISTSTSSMWTSRPTTAQLVS